MGVNSYTVTAGPKVTKIYATSYAIGKLLVFSILWNGSCTNADLIATFNNISISSNVYIGGIITVNGATSPAIYLAGNQVKQQSTTAAAGAGALTGVLKLA